MFAVFGREHYTAVMIAQALIDTNTCLVIAGLALELINARAAKAAICWRHCARSRQVTSLLRFLRRWPSAASRMRFTMAYAD